MTPPISPSDLQRVLKTLPPERPDQFPHLADLTPDALLRRKVRITQIAKRCEQERHAIDAELLSTFGDAELRFGVRAPGGWILRSRTRTSWDYDPEVRDVIKGLQDQAQRDGRAQPLVSTYLCLTQEST
jgi:hypothetical protein